MFNISKIAKLFNKKNRLIEDQKAILLKQGVEIERLQEKLKDSQCLVRELQDIIEANAKKREEYMRNEHEYEKIVVESIELRDWIKDCPTFKSNGGE